MSSLRTKFAQDLIWNYASLVVLAISGVSINFTISFFYGPEALGIFNQVFAFYIVASQIGAAGIHFSVLKHVAQHEGNAREQQASFFSALVLVVGFSAVITLILVGTRSAIGRALSSPSVGVALGYAAFGFFFFPLNKVLLSLLNAKRSMRAFAAGQALRYLLLLGFIPMVAALRWPAPALSIVFSLSEGVLFLFLLTLALVDLQGRLGKVSRYWIRTHLSFGYRGFVGGTLVELNSRIDVLMIGWLLSDWAVGIYSFAATLAEGFYQILIVVKNNLNPILIQMIHEKNFEKLRALRRQTLKWVYLSVIPLSVLLVAAYPLGIWAFSLNEDFLLGWPVLIILTAGIALISGFSPFDTLLIQGGYPGTQTLLNTATVLLNALLNFALIPLWGIQGAALATACSLITTLGLLHLLVARRLGFRLVGVR